MRVSVAIGAALLAFFAVGNAKAQIPSPPPTQYNISPEKRELIKQLATVTKLNEMTEKTTGIMLDQFALQVPGMLSQVVGDPSMTGKEKADFDKAVAESTTRVMKRIKDLLPTRVNISDLMNQIFYPIYDKYFTEQELRDLVAFYKTPTGQKSIEVMPDLFKETLDKTSELLNAKLSALVREVFEEEKKHLLDK
jgi:hypothetical protein